MASLTMGFWTPLVFSPNYETSFVEKIAKTVDTYLSSGTKRAVIMRKVKGVYEVVLENARVENTIFKRAIKIALIIVFPLGLIALTFKYLIRKGLTIKIVNLTNHFDKTIWSSLSSIKIHKIADHLNELKGGFEIIKIPGKLERNHLLIVEAAGLNKENLLNDVSIYMNSTIFAIYVKLNRQLSLGSLSVQREYVATCKKSFLFRNQTDEKIQEKLSQGWVDVEDGLLKIFF